MVRVAAVRLAQGLRVPWRGLLFPGLSDLDRKELPIRLCGRNLGQDCRQYVGLISSTLCDLHSPQYCWCASPHPVIVGGLQDLT